MDKINFLVRLILSKENDKQVNIPFFPLYFSSINIFSTL